MKCLPDQMYPWSRSVTPPPTFWLPTCLACAVARFCGQIVHFGGFGEGPFFVFNYLFFPRHLENQAKGNVHRPKMKFLECHFQPRFHFFPTLCVAQVCLFCLWNILLFLVMFGLYLLKYQEGLFLVVPKNANTLDVLEYATGTRKMNGPHKRQRGQKHLLKFPVVQPLSRWMWMFYWWRILCRLLGRWSPMCCTLGRRPAPTPCSMLAIIPRGGGRKYTHMYIHISVCMHMCIYVHMCTWALHPQRRLMGGPEFSPQLLVLQILAPFCTHRDSCFILVSSPPF